MKTYPQIILLLLLSFNLLAQPKQKSSPVWAVDYNYLDAPEIDASELSDGIFTLLYTEQVNIPEQTYYAKITKKITDNVGISDVSTLNIDYDPTYQQLYIHSITVYRGDKKIDKLDLKNFEVLRRESDAENFIYDGSLSAMLHLSDIRTGDIVEYSYSLQGFNPIDSKYSGSFYLNDIVPMGISAIHIFTKSPINYKVFNDDLKPEITEKNGLKNYAWLLQNTTVQTFEDNTPSWVLTYKRLMVSEYNEWSEVVDWGLKVYDVSFLPSQEFNNLVKRINNTSKTEGEKISQALNFVQDEVRYLGLENGIGAYQPFSPNKVLENRFGDCKDKSLLLVKLLNALEIEAYPMLVNTYLKKTILELPPSTKFFNHCVVKVIDSKNREFWYDPTMQNQGGNYNTTYFPDYRYGLVLTEGSSVFDEIEPSMTNKTEVIDNYYLEAVGGNAILEVKSVYRENSADEMRNYFRNNSLNSIKSEYKDYYDRLYKSVQVLSEPKYEDDSLKNVLITYEKYQIDSLWNPHEMKKNYIAAEFYPYSIYDIFLVPEKSDRKLPFELSYPATKEHKVNIHLPIQWSAKNENDITSNDYFYYTDNISYDRKTKTINAEYYFKYQNDFVPANGFRNYYNEANKANKRMGYTIFHPALDMAIKGNKNTNQFAKIFLSIFWIAAILVGVVVVALIVYVVVNSKKST